MILGLTFKEPQLNMFFFFDVFVIIGMKKNESFQELLLVRTRNISLKTEDKLRQYPLGHSGFTFCLNG